MGAVRGRLGDVSLALIITVAVVALMIRAAPSGGGYFVQILTFGVANGSIYALVALGYTLVYGIIELINFAHGDVFTLGGFISLALLPLFGVEEGDTSGLAIVLPLVAVFALTMLACAAVNVTIERVAYRPLRYA